MTLSPIHARALRTLFSELDSQVQVMSQRTQAAQFVPEHFNFRYFRKVKFQRNALGRVLHQIKEAA